MGGGGTTSTSKSKVYNWKDILPPWAQAGQQLMLPWFLQRAQTGMLPSEERTLWGQAKDILESSGQEATRALSRKLATSGIEAGSPAAAAGFAELGLDKLRNVSKAALDFAKVKMGAKDTAIGQLLTAMYTPPPVAVGTTSSTVSNQGK